MPQRVVCMETLSNASMKPGLLIRHLESNHVEKKKREQSYFERLGQKVIRQHLDQTGQFYQKKVGIVKASYKVALLVVQNMKPHTIEESLVFSAATILVRSLIGKVEAAKLDRVFLFNDAVKHRIQETSIDIAEQVIVGVKDSKFGFAIQLDESTDVAKCSQLLVYARFTQNNTVKTELLFSQVVATTKGKDVSNVLANFFEQKELEWKTLVGCTTDGAPTMLERNSEFKA